MGDLKGTGKSYLFGGVSRYGYLSAGKMTRAKLFYDRDLQEDKEPLFDAFDTVEANLKVFTAMVSSAKF